MTDYQGVIAAWDQRSDDYAAVHPLGRDRDEFWRSGWTQVQEVADVAGEGSRVLDFGCGPGRLTIPLAELGYEVYAADASVNMLAEVEKNAAERGVNVKTIQSDSSDIAKHFGRKKADVVVARAVFIHHAYDDITRMVTNLAGVLKKGGHLIADWPAEGQQHERRDWIDVTVWERGHRDRVAAEAGLEPVRVDAQPTVWRKA